MLRKTQNYCIIAESWITINRESLVMQNKKISWGVLAIVLATFASFFMLKGSGFFEQPTILEVSLGVILIVTLASSKWSYRLLLLPITIGYTLYTPVGLAFGKPTYSYIASIFATDLMEGKEFLQQLEPLNMVIAIGILLAVVFHRKFAKKANFRPLANKTFVISAMVISLFSQAPFKFFNEFFAESMKVKRELEVLNNLAIGSKWGNSTLSLNSKYDDYILIIGESARKDYHNAYGYPVENTPFMSSAKGTLIDGFTAGGTNTIASLKLMLTKPNTKTWEGNYELSLIDLIKSAGVLTYWISNQGYLGQFDTPVSSLANKSDVKIFMKSGDSFNQNISDFELLPKFNQVLEQPATGKRFIVLHLYGSHPIACDRLTDYPKIFDEDKLAKKYHDVNCYISTIKKTDEVLKRVYETLMKNSAKQNRTFSMVYFSDHGLSHDLKDNYIAIHNSAGKSKLHYEIPLFKISFDDTERKVYKVFKSGLNFTDGIANWIGIENPLLNQAVDLFGNFADPDDYGLKAKIDEIDVPLDPAIVIPKP